MGGREKGCVCEKGGGACSVIADVGVIDWEPCG